VNDEVEQPAQLGPEALARLKRKRLVDAYRHTFENTEGGLIVLGEMELSLGRRPSFHRDPYLTAYHEGQRSTYLHILELIQEAKQPPPVDRTVVSDTPEEEPA
jgi:hypothetical protein